MQYVCEKKHFNKRLYKVGMVVDLQEEQLPRNKEGKILFFRPLEEVKVEAEPEKEKDWKCEWCEKVAKSKAGLMAHKRICSMNPDLIGLAR
jgi:hypothetical protein